ncbi:MarR family transcriptional regulator [Ethanoligenens sp.]|uniref:MarR family transcriptional regulator n=1 Tax=Ethanoligenens sp. TaxID=2099655 RepID=UPI0039EC9B7B
MAEKESNSIRPSADVLIETIRQQFLSVSNRHAAEVDRETQILLQNCRQPDMAKVIQELTVISIHILNAIGELEPVNSAKIARQTGIPKGTVSKNIRKLLLKQLILKEHVPGNKKESVFHLTTLGRDLSALHIEMHRRMDDEMTAFLSQYSLNDLQVLAKILKDYNNASWSDGEKRQ